MFYYFEFNYPRILVKYMYNVFDSWSLQKSYMYAYQE